MTHENSGKGKKKTNIIDISGYKIKVSKLKYLGG
jgi:hypothetical protein